MKITKRQLRRIIREEKEKLLSNKSIISEEPKVDLSPDKKKEEDKDLDISDLGMSIPPTLKRLLDPDVSPAKYADLDQAVDEADNINHQGLAIAAFALSYSDMDESSATRILVKAKELVPKIIKAKQKK
jgi:hypothetical protein